MRLSSRARSRGSVCEYREVSMQRIVRSWFAVSVALVACSSATTGKPPPGPTLPGASAPAAQPAPRSPEGEASAAPTSAPTPDARRHQLTALLDDQWQYTLRQSPEFASILGDRRYNDRWS